MFVTGAGLFEIGDTDAAAATFVALAFGEDELDPLSEGLMPALAGEFSAEEDGEVAESALGFLLCKAKRAASWRRARDGGMLRGGGICGAVAFASLLVDEESGVAAASADEVEAESVVDCCWLSEDADCAGGEKTESAPSAGGAKEY